MKALRWPVIDWQAAFGQSAFPSNKLRAKVKKETQVKIEIVVIWWWWLQGPYMS